LYRFIIIINTSNSTAPYLRDQPIHRLIYVTTHITINVHGIIQKFKHYIMVNLILHLTVEQK